MFCYQCGTSLPDVAIFCSECGSRVVTSASAFEAEPLRRPSSLRNAVVILLGAGGVVAFLVLLGLVGWLTQDESERSGNASMADTITAFVVLEALAMPALVVGWALLVSKKWAKTAAIVWSAIVCFTLVGAVVGGPVLYLLTRKEVGEYLKSQNCGTSRAAPMAAAAGVASRDPVPSRSPDSSARLDEGVTQEYLPEPLAAASDAAPVADGTPDSAHAIGEIARSESEDSASDAQMLEAAILSAVPGATVDDFKGTDVGRVLDALDRYSQSGDLGWVDGYAPGEYDEFHWDQFFGAILAIGLGVLFLSISVDMGARAPMWLIPAALGLFAVAVAGCLWSGFWRRYRYLVWWKKLIIVLSSLVAVCAQLALVLIWAFITQLLGQGASSSAPKASRDENVAVDRDGNAYEWNAWRGTWEPKWRWVGQEQRRVKQGFLGPSEVRRGFLNMPQETEGGERLYEADD